MAVIYADVVTRIDERSADAAAKQLQDQFGQVSASLREKGAEAGTGFADGLSDGILDGMGNVGSSIGGLTKILREFGATELAYGIVAGSGITAAAAAAAKLEVALYGVGQRYDAMASSIAIQTGRMGESLDALDESVRNVSRNTASSIEDIAAVASSVSQAFDISGAPLENLAKQVTDLNRMTGQNLDMRDFGMVLRGFGSDGQGASQALDALTAAAQRSGIPINELLGNLQNAAPAARSLGMDLDDTAGLIVAFERAGIDADKTVSGLNRAVAQFADHNIDLKTGLGDTITQIRGFIDAGNDAAAVDLAGKVFGDRSAQVFVDAIRQGTVNLQTLNQGLGQTDGTIDKLDDQTANWQQSWDKLKNTTADIADVIGSELFDTIDKAAARALDFVNILLSAPSASGNISSGAPMGPSTPFTLGNLLPPGVSPTGGGEPTGSPSVPDLSAQFPWLAPSLNLPAAGPRTPDDIAGALADATGRGAGAGALSAPVLPYAPGYGQPPMPGETQDQWQARMANMAAEHDLAEARARLTQLEQQGNADANATVAARNAVIDAEMRAWQAQQRMLQSRMQQLQVVDVPYPDAYGQGPRPGQTASQYSAEGAVYEAQQKAAQAQANYQQMVASGTASAQDLAAASNALIEARRTEQETMLRLADAYKDNGESAKAATAQLAELGNQIDNDFGASEGLAGIAENITRFVANLAMAPMIGQLQGVQLANGGYGGGLGSGLAGMLGLASGMGAAAAAPQVAAGQASAMPYIAPYNPGYMVAPSAVPNFPGAAMSGAYPGDAALLANVPAGRYTQEERGDLTQGLADCTSSIEDLVNLMDGRPTAGASLSTSNADQWLQSRGFMPGTMPGAFNVGFWDGPGNSGHMQATMPDGTPFNWGSDAAAAARGIGGTGAFDPAFTSHYYRPVSRSTPDGGDMGGYAELSPDQLTSTGLMTPIPLGADGGPGGMAAGPMASRFGGRPTGPLPGPAAPSQSVIGGRAFGQGTAPSGGIGFGGSGLLGAAGQAASAAGMAASLGAGGMDGGAGGAVASVAAQIGIQELQRAAGAVGQYAGNAVGGLMETFSLNDSALGDPSRSWLGRLATAAAGVRPSLPNTAGKEGGAANPNMAEAGKQPPGPLTPQQAEATKAVDGQNGANVSNTVNNQVTVNNQRATEDYTGQTIQAHLGAQAMAGAPR